MLDGDGAQWLIEKMDDGVDHLKLMTVRIDRADLLDVVCNVIDVDVGEVKKRLGSHSLVFLGGGTGPNDTKSPNVRQLGVSVVKALDGVFPLGHDIPVIGFRGDESLLDAPGP